MRRTDIKHDDHFDQVHLPLTEFAAFFRGQQVEDAPPLDLTKVARKKIIIKKFRSSSITIYTSSKQTIIPAQIGAFGLQTFGGVYDDFKQSGVGTLEIDSVSLY